MKITSNIEKRVENKASSRQQLGKEDIEQVLSMEVEKVWDCVERGVEA